MSGDRILIVIPWMVMGGAERVTARLANHWQAAGRQVTIATFGPEDRDFYPLSAGVNRVVLGELRQSRGLVDALGANWRRIVQLRQAVRESRAEIVLGMMDTASSLAALATVGQPVRTYGAERTYPGARRYGRVWSLVRRMAFGLLQGVVVQTPETGAWIRTHTGARSVQVVPNAVQWPLDAFEPTLDPAETAPPGRRLLLAAGRLDSGKGFDLLLRGFADLAARHPDWRLVILGEGGERPRLEALIAELGLTGCAALPGSAGNMADWYARADLFVMTSLFEGFPNAILEAMAAGLPVVSFDCDVGPRNIIRDGVDGILTPVGDVGALARELDRLMADDGLRTELGKRAHEVHDRFSEARILQAWDQALGLVDR